MSVYHFLIVKTTIYKESNTKRLRKLVFGGILYFDDDLIWFFVCKATPLRLEQKTISDIVDAPRAKEHAAKQKDDSVGAFV